MPSYNRVTQNSCWGAQLISKADFKVHKYRHFQRVTGKTPCLSTAGCRPWGCCLSLPAARDPLTPEQSRAAFFGGLGVAAAEPCQPLGEGADLKTFPFTGIHTSKAQGRIFRRSWWV